MFTRQDYMNDKVSHREYYAQFVNEDVKRMVLNMFTLVELENAYRKDEYFNNLPMKKWDQLGGFVFNSHTGEMIMKPTTISPVDIKLIRELGEGVSASTMVCIYKEAAKQIVEDLPF